MRATDHKFRLPDGDLVRVVVAGDVVSIVGSADNARDSWSMGGFGRGISVEWMLHSGDLRGNLKRRRLLAECVVRALELHHAPPAASDGAS